MIYMKKSNVSLKNGTVNQFVVDGIIYADETPQTLPVSGAGVDNMEDNEFFAIGTILYVIEDATPKWYIWNGAEFVGQ